MTAIEDLARYIYARMPSETPEDARTTWDDLTEQQRDIYRAHARNAAITLPDQHPEADAEIGTQMTDDITSRARAALEGVTRPWRWSGGDGDDPALVFIDAAPGLMSGLLAEVERLRAGREVERGMLTAAAAEIQDLGFKVEQLQAEQDEDRDEIHTLRRHLADEEAEVERLRGALDRMADEWKAKIAATDITNSYGAGISYCLLDLRDVLRADQ